MKQKITVMVLLALVVLLFPISSTQNLSGEGEVLNRQKEKVGTCQLEVEITEVSSLVFTYKKAFTFVLDGRPVEEFATDSHSEIEDICLLSQMYYDEEQNEMSLCSLIYKKDLSYAVLELGENYYFIRNGADIAYSELPVS